MRGGWGILTRWTVGVGDVFATCWIRRCYPSDDYGWNNTRCHILYNVTCMRARLNWDFDQIFMKSKRMAWEKEQPLFARWKIELIITLAMTVILYLISWYVYC